MSNNSTLKTVQNITEGDFKSTIEYHVSGVSLSIQDLDFPTMSYIAYAIKQSPALFFKTMTSCIQNVYKNSKNLE